MMTVPMNSSPAPSSRELVQRLYKKNIQLENALQRSAQSKVPADANAWLQMRENYEVIILKDRDFSEKYEIELLLWQLHYKRIEEFRSRISAAASRDSGASEIGKNNAQPDRIKRIRSFFKSFLSEATGFYHDLILKIRAKCGLPLDYFLEGPEDQSLPMDEKRSAEMKKGLVSCQRCLIYLGDLARYKGLYGEGDSVIRDYAPASSYYMQAASLCPSSGNPHNQLAILASYSGDDLVAIYRYSRSLAVENPFPTARDNLIIAFEKNRQSYSQLPSNTKVTPSWIVPSRSAGRRKGRGDTRLLAKDTRTEANVVKGECNTFEIFKVFSTRFVRLNGILFTRTSLETFEDIFSLVSSDMHELLSSGPEEELNFGTDAAENALVGLRLIAILIFTVHNVVRESESQSYAEILQRTVILKNAFTAAFEFVGYILRRCTQLHDAASSFFLPAIMVFIEWLACHPDVAAGSNVEEKQAKARSFFWNQCVSFMNKLVLTGLASIDHDDDDTCFSDMSMYDEGETSNRCALWEDYELRGFLPLIPAQLILDFSRKHTFGIDGSTKEKRARVQRIVAAGRALMDVVRIDEKKIFFDPHLKKFIMCVYPSACEVSEPNGLTNMSESNNNISESNITEGGSQNEHRVELGAKIVSPGNLRGTQSKALVNVEGEEDEVIVFKPAGSGKLNGLTTSVLNAAGINQAVQMSVACRTTYDAPLSAPLSNVQTSTVSNASSHLCATTTISQLPHSSNTDVSEWRIEGESLFSDGFKNLNITGNDLLDEQRLHRGLSSPQPLAFWPQISSAANLDTMNVLSSQIKATEVAIPSTLDSVVFSGATSDGINLKFASALQTLPKKNPVSRPTRHIGPPPGFSHAPKQQEKPASISVMEDQQPHIGDYSWLDGYQPSSTKGMGTEKSIDKTRSAYPNINSTSSVFNEDTSFPFPGKQVSSVQTDALNEKKWQDLLLFEQLKPYAEQQFQEIKPQHLLPEQQPTRSLWSGNFFV
ncbi:nonsense-mediated mRNA decay factor SMG7-like [Typha angustifolia]|uniref:nonsense-mediated mRNA decay factor SMG7-like n=1 Tax=Typha angustifolia TaxID=59011 RepID=UPI003C2C8E16